MWMFFLGAALGAALMFLVVCTLLLEGKDKAIATGRIVMDGKEYWVNPVHDDNTSGD